MVATTEKVNLQSSPSRLDRLKGVWPAMAQTAAKVGAAAGAAFVAAKENPRKTAGLATAAAAAAAISPGFVLSCAAAKVCYAGCMGAFARAPQEWKEGAVAGLTSAGKAALGYAWQNPAKAAAVGTAAGLALLGAPVLLSGAAFAIALPNVPSPLGANNNPPSPPPEPVAEDWGPSLENISAIADQGQRGAAALGAKPGKAWENYQKEIAQIQPPPPVAPDEVADAPAPHLRVIGGNWEAELKASLNPLCNQFSIASTFKVMLDWAGAENFSESRILELTGKIQSGKEKRSIWQIFNAECKDLSSLQKIKAGFAYWIFFQTGLMHHIIGSLVKHNFDKFTKAFDAPSDAARIGMFHTFLTHGNQLLAGEWQAAKDCVKGKKLPNLKDGDYQSYRKWIIENRYGFDLGKLCRESSKNMVEKDPFEILFFRSLHDIPVLGPLSRALQSGINRLIKNKLKGVILPGALQSAVDKSTELTKPRELKFAIKATQLLTLMMEKFREEIPNLGKGPNSLAISPLDQGQVQTFAKNLINALNLKGCKDVEDLRKILNPTSESWNEWCKRAVRGEARFTQEAVNEELRKVLEVALFEGVNQLFTHFNEMSKSKELSVLVLQLAGELFSEDEMDAEKLQDGFADAQTRLNEVSEDLMHKLITRSLEQLTEPEGEVKQDRSIIQPLFEQAHKITETTLKALNGISSGLPGKVAAGTNVQEDLAAVFAILKGFSINRKMRGEMKQIKDEHKLRLWTALTPYHRRIDEMTQAALELQGAQGQYTSHNEVAKVLDEIGALLAKIDDDMAAGVVSLSVQGLSAHKQTIVNCLEHPDKEAAVISRVEGHVQGVQEVSASIGEKQKIIHACENLRDTLVQWNSFRSQRTVHTLFRSHPDFAKEVRAALKCFPQEQRTALEKLICANGSGIDSKWKEISAIIGLVHRDTTTEQAALKTELKNKIAEASAWSAKTAHQYRIKAEANFARMQNQAKLMEAEIREMASSIPGKTLPDQSGKPAAERTVDKIRVGLLTYTRIGTVIKGLVKTRIEELATSARLYSHDPLVARALTTRLIAEIGG